MSSVTSTTQTPPIDLRVRGQEVIDKLGYMPAEVAGALRWRVLDLMLHTRSSVGKGVARQFPSGRRAQKRWFARSFQYSREAAEINAVAGEVFAVGGAANPAKRGRDFWDLLQTGGVIYSRSPMFIPFSIARDTVIVNRAERSRTFIQSTATRQGFALGDPRVSVINTRRRQGLVAFEPSRFDARTRRGIASTTLLVGVLRRSRRQPKLLGFVESFQSVYPQHAAQFDRVFDRVLTERGRASVAAETERLREAVLSRIGRTRGPGVGTNKQIADRSARRERTVRVSPPNTGSA